MIQPRFCIICGKLIERKKKDPKTYAESNYCSHTCIGNEAKDDTQLYCDPTNRLNWTYGTLKIKVKKVEAGWVWQSFRGNKKSICSCYPFDTLDRCLEDIKEAMGS